MPWESGYATAKAESDEKRSLRRRKIVIGALAGMGIGWILYPIMGELLTSEIAVAVVFALAFAGAAAIGREAWYEVRY